MKNETVASCELRVASKGNRLPLAPSPPPPLFSGRQRPAFTLIELLTVIGIIVLLASMLFLAYNHVTTSTKIRDTKTALEAAKTLFDNYKQATHLTKPLVDLSTNLSQAVTITWPPSNTQLTPINSFWAPPAASPTINLVTYWSIGYESPTASTPTAMGETAPGAITIDALTGVVTAKPPTNIYQYPYPPTDPVSTLLRLPKNTLPQQLVDTISVMYTLEQVPDNKAIIANLPTQRKMILPLAITNKGNGATSQTLVTLLLDGWGNPILFVPAIGLYGVETKSAVDNFDPARTYTQGDQVISKFTDSNNVVHYYLNTWVSPMASNKVSPSNPPPPSPPPPGIPADAYWGGLCAPGLRHYWVSGGPDGNVSTHDDNLYSFQD
ncbi:MAG: type II secretion system protein [Tepidisphaeraceae bacterium]|jgi:prepilin-type N-terminal cleavage/methylation domain-containing protein